MAMIKIKNLSKCYGSNCVFKDFNLDIEKGKITVILGESGAGKTTLLKILLGLTDYQGEIQGEFAPVSVVMQANALIPNLTVGQNLTLVNKGMDVKNALKEAGMENAENLYPKELSAGMARRVAILRAIYFPSKTLFLDEPFINLDLKHKYLMLEKIKEQAKANGQTVICVTHDPREAVALADRIVVLKNREIIYDEKDVGENTESKLIEVLINS